MNQVPLLQPTGNAGEYLIPALGQKVKLVKWKEDDYFDTVYRALGAITAGTKLKFFTDSVTSKNLQHTNFAQQRRINSGSDMVMSRVGILICQATGNVITDGDDILKAAYSASIQFKIGKERIVAEGPLVKYQTGLGMTGSTVKNNAAVLTTGVPSAAAAPQLLVAQPITDKDDLYADLAFEDGTGLNAAYVMPTMTGVTSYSIFLHGLIKGA